jgi:hypothetical protein
VVGVKAFDATTVLMSDTQANQAAYPQHSNQKSGLWLSALEASGVVLRDHGSGAGGGDGPLSSQ